MKTRKGVWSLVIATSFLTLWTRFGPEGKSQPATANAAAGRSPMLASLKLAGTGSCSARGCHGGLQREEPAAERALCLDEYPRWLLHDKHASAHDALFNQHSQEIVKNLRLERQAHEEARCLACHTNPLAAAPEAAPLLKAERLFGVGCESCHGGAANWLQEHTTPVWNTKSAAYKNAQGMFPVADLRARAKMCAGCHIGAPPDAAGEIPARDMNHDLIAAGHPALNFEFSAFTADLPAHWSVKLKKTESSTQLWLLGQVAAAEVACELLAYRAGPVPGPKEFAKPWPELSEYNCFACHHDLRAKSWRQARGYGKGNVPGALSWGTWYLMMPETLAHQQGKMSVLESLRQVRAEMCKPGPNKTAVVQRAKALAKQLGEWNSALALEEYPHAKMRSLLREITEERTNTAVPSWDSAAQLYLAVLALNRSHPKPDMQLEESLTALYRKLAFPANFDSPQEIDQDEGFDAFLRRYHSALGGLLK